VTPNTIVQGDILQWAAAYDGEPFHALLCDPPYHLTEIVKRFGSPDAAPAQFGTDGAFQRASKGFMGKDWDGGDIAFRPETWYAVSALLYPGAFGMAFAGSRGWHRMACAIEDAGLIIHPTVFGWSYLSGFPKATRLDPQIDRRAGAERAVVGRKKHAPKFDAARHGYREKDNGYNSREREDFALTAPATDLAAAWRGHRYGLQALKPALEPIIVFQRPYEGRPVDCITATGAGALNIDGGRIGTGDDLNGGSYGNTTRDSDRFFTGKRPSGGGEFVQPAGRWPANLALSHHPACADACHENCAVRRLGEQSGERSSGYMEGTYSGKSRGIYGDYGNHRTAGTYADTGTAARMFYNADWMYERLEAADGVGYYPKASTAEREAGLDPLYALIMGRLYGDFDETTVDDGRKTPIDNPYLRGETDRRNTHPTIKPLSLARWLATLLLPPDLYAPRRLLVPFAGAGSEMIGAMLAGWEAVQGVELDADHVRIAQARIAYWRARRHEFADGRPITASTPRKAPEGQASLFDTLEDDA
jgi:site-specific DNA-methyltransferase (adenine-specific)